MLISPKDDFAEKRNHRKVREQTEKKKENDRYEKQDESLKIHFETGSTFHSHLCLSFCGYQIDHRLQRMLVIRYVE